MADLYVVTSADPVLNAAGSSVSLSTTYKAVLPVGQLAPLGIHAFGKISKTCRITVFGALTTAATPGNIQVGLLYGTGADNNGVTVCQSATTALVANQTSMTFRVDFLVTCRTTGATGTLIGLGEAGFNPAVVASTAQPVMIPASAPAVSSSVDLTNGALVLSPQILRSGNTAETVVIHGYVQEWLN